MSTLCEICLIGDIVIDLSLSKEKGKDNKMRLGGLAHAARGLWALDALFSVEFFSPQYLDKGIIDFLSYHGCHQITKIGNVTGAPYLFLISEMKEIGDQGYEFILRDEISIHYDEKNLNSLLNKSYSDILIVSGNYSIQEIFCKLNKDANIHIDLANNVEDFSFMDSIKKKVSTIFLSTSSKLFQKKYDGDFEKFSQSFKPYTDMFILKENRGGSRGANFIENKTVTIPSQTRPICHSVGVGDVFDAVFVNNYRKCGFENSLVLSSWIAAEYASTTYPDDFKLGVKRILSSTLNDLKELGGVTLAWEDRILINIYIAAPDFNYIDTSFIEVLCNSLTYHNFNPRRPIKENGQLEKDSTLSQKQEVFSKDMELISSCQILIAVLLDNDPGTLIELGIAATMKIPTIVFDPYNIANNCMLTQLPNLVSNDLDEVISEVFSFGSKLIKK